MFTTLISPQELSSLIDRGAVSVFDCRFDLADTEAGRRAYREGHIPGALYAHLDEDLSGPIFPGQTGRHPLPLVEVAADRFGQWGIEAGRQVVVYDDKRGAIAARLWWMLRWLGHDEVAVLEGGWQSWKAAGLPVSDQVEEVRTVLFEPRPREAWVASVLEVDQLRKTAGHTVVDSRGAERYRGEEEPIDPVAGHIPGAVNLPFPDNWQADGTMKSKTELAARFQELPSPDKTIFYCGSGVTACHNILAYAHAGLGMARLYPGSWSEWITDEERPVATGE